MKELLKKIIWHFQFLKNLFYKKELRMLRNSRFFDEKYYFLMRPDVAAAKKDLALHYLLFGWKEHVNPSDYFSTDEYLRAYPDVNFNPLLHYEWFGRKEGRCAGVRAFPVEQIDMLSRTVNADLGRKLESFKRKLSSLEEEERNHRRQTVEIQLVVQEERKIRREISEQLKKSTDIIKVQQQQIDDLKRELSDVKISCEEKTTMQQKLAEKAISIYKEEFENKLSQQQNNFSSMKNYFEDRLSQLKNYSDEKLLQQQIVFEKEALEYQKKEQEKTLQREEDALKIQRNVFEIEKKMWEQQKSVDNCIKKAENALETTAKEKQIVQQLQKIGDKLQCDLQAANKRMNYLYYKGLHPDQYAENLKEWFHRSTGEILHLENPQTFNEKIQWLKLYDSTPLKTRLADKYLVRDWVKEKIGEKYLIPLLGVWNKFDDIDFDTLPNQFVLKCNHGCGYNIIVKDKSTLNIADAKNKINTWMNENYAFRCGLELHYSPIPRKIIAEKYLDEINDGIFDYRFFCFDGKCKQIWLDIASGTPEHKRKVYDSNWNELDIIVKWPRLEKDIEKPANLNKLIEFSEKLSQGFSFVRVDFYNQNNHIYFGEMTFTSMSGIGTFSPESENFKLGDLIQLPLENKR